MKNKVNDSYLIVLIAAFFVTVVMTPWLNSDSLIIPKLIVLFATAMFLTPRIIAFMKVKNSERLTKVVLLLASLIFIQMILVVFTTSSPIEQQIYGRTGRGLGFITEFSILIFLCTAYFSSTPEKIKYFYYFFMGSCLISSGYSILQRFGLDIFDWNTRTNGIIGTLGNPNFQSSFAAMALMPSLIYFLGSKYGLIKSITLTLPLLITIYICQSTQGYVSAAIGVAVLLLVYTWYKKRLVFYTASAFSIISFWLIIQGILNNGPLANYLYKASVASRGEMLRNSFSVAKDNPIFGVGLDSLGDFYLKYKDAKTLAGVNEFTDHAHNAIVNNAATGGFPFAILQLLIVLLVLGVSIAVIKKSKSFNKETAILFSVWVCFQAQSMISPSNISMMVWNSLISGTLLSQYRNLGIQAEVKQVDIRKVFDLTKPFSLFLLLISIMICFPYYNVDRMQVVSAKTGNGELAMKSAFSFPQSTVRYSRIADAFIESNLAPQALELGRAAAKFNPNAPSAWGLILVNNLATREERIKAKNELIKLDPQNIEIRNFVIP